MEDKENRRADKWHVGKEIPLAMLFAIAVQTCGAVWWAATMSTKLDNLAFQVAALTADKYSAHDAQRDQALTNERIDNLKRNIDQLKEDLSWRRRR